VLLTLVGGTLAAGGANAINMYVDRDIDALMKRTQDRPLVTGVIEPTHALAFALALEVAAFAVLWWGANLLSALLALSAAAFYVGIYTLWLKVLFVTMFLWTPPHFWALAIRYADDYRAADVPMLPAVAPVSEAARQMIGYTVALVAATLVLVPVADLGWIYTSAAVLLGAGFLVATIALARIPTPAVSMRVFTFSITYVTVLFAAITVDVLVLG
jgi:protoheme IX farnesyltransferase